MNSRHEAAIVAAALAWNRARLRRVEAERRSIPKGGDPPFFSDAYHRRKDAEAARAHALKEESKAKAALRKACMLADPAAVILNADAVELAQDNPALHLAREVAQGVNKAVQDGIESAEG